MNFTNSKWELDSTGNLVFGIENNNTTIDGYIIAKTNHFGIIPVFTLSNKVKSFTKVESTGKCWKRALNAEITEP